MPTRNALASARLSYTQATPTDPYRVTLQVWSHSYDHPTPSRRSAVVSGVKLTQLSQLPPLPNPGSTITNVAITDRYGISHADLWTLGYGGGEQGFVGHVEWDNGSKVVWSASSGIYDERCAADQTCDRLRLQTFRHTAVDEITVYNYLPGPLTFAFDIKLSAPPTAVRLQLSLQGGNGGNPAQRTPLLLDEEFVINFP